MDEQAQLKENLKDIYRSLPEAIKEVIFAPETSQVYDDVKAKYQLTDTQRTALSVQTGLLLMGLREPQELVSVFIDQLGIPREKAALIAQELNRDLFGKVKDALKEVYGLGQGQQTSPSIALNANSQRRSLDTAALERPIGVAPAMPTKPAAATPSALGTAPIAKVTPPQAPTPQKAASKETEASKETPVAFSLSKALGKIPATSTSPDTTLQTPPKAPAPAPATLGGQPNILEGKLGGTFKSGSDKVVYNVPKAPSAASAGQSTDTIGAVVPPKQIIPPPPTPTIPQAPKSDPYRETV